ncbi:mechanosensitive ion channel family protein [Chloroflexota bacterium]
MQPQFVSGSPLLEALWAVGIVFISILVAWLISIGMERLKPRLKKRLKSTFVPQLMESLSKPVVLLMVAEGILIALSSLSYLAPWEPVLGKIGIAVVIIIATYGLARSGGMLLGWYLRAAPVRRKARIDEGLIRFLQRVILIVIYAIGILILLDYLNISITPLIAGLGISGLAIALALQPTLGNFFAGTQIISDRVVRVGDYIELENDAIRGYVTDVGWRSTRIRTPYNNLIIIPNSRLADNILTNYYSPGMEVGVIVNCGVSYNSNLDLVETLATAVAKEVVDDLDEAVKTFEPVFRYEEFGDSNINFWVWLQATDRLASFRMRSELIKRLKARFDQEGITINYPVRTTYLHWSEGIPPVSLSHDPSPDSPEDSL